MPLPLPAALADRPRPRRGRAARRLRHEAQEADLLPAVRADGQVVQPQTGVFEPQRRQRDVVVLVLGGVAAVRGAEPERDRDKVQRGGPRRGPAPTRPSRSAPWTCRCSTSRRGAAS